MIKKIIEIIVMAYILITMLLILTFNNELTIFILLQNTIFFIFFSYLIFISYLNYPEELFTTASIVTYLRMLISILLLTACINASINENIYNIFYVEKIFIILAIISFFLDGIDGFIARNFNQKTKFGEFFDQESDNFLMLVLSVSIYLTKEISPIVFLIPSYRYIFIIFMKKYIWLAKDLPKSISRKFYCILIIGLMIIIQDDSISDIESLKVVIFALFIITFSFVKDILWLYRKKNEYL